MNTKGFSFEDPSGYLFKPLTSIYNTVAMAGHISQDNELKLTFIIHTTWLTCGPADYTSH
jgi:hypothetical protein